MTGRELCQNIPTVSRIASKLNSTLMARKHKSSRARLLHHKHRVAAPSEQVLPVDVHLTGAVSQKQSPISRKGMHFIAALVLAGACSLLYGWTLNFPMVFDDHLYLKNNPLVKDSASFTYAADFQNFATWPARHGMEPDLATNFILRPVAYATFFANYALDGFDPAGWRVINILVHVANAWLIYALLTLLLSQAAGRALPQRSVGFIAFTASALFAVHPMAIESVTFSSYSLWGCISRRPK